ncbi:MAG: hypothetical protein AB7O52_10800 [Planctomycetota bacterium]
MASLASTRTFARISFAAFLVLAPAWVFAVPGQLLLSVPFPGLAPQDITYDASDNTFWVTSLTDGVIRHFDDDFTLLGSIPSPFLFNDAATGIAYFPPRDSLLVVQPTSFELLEIDKTGAPVIGGIQLFLPVQSVVNPMGGPFLRGLAYYANGNGGLGSLWVVETVGALIYEFDLTGGILQTFEHPDDPDGFPGLGAGADAGGLELVLDGSGVLVGFDVVGSDAGVPVIRRLDGSGAYAGISIPLVNVGAGTGGIGGLVRVPFVDVNGTPFDALRGTSESTARLFVIDGAVPPIADLVSLSCSSAGNTITLDWTTSQTYDFVLVERNGSPLQVLPGAATQFVDAGLAPGVYRYEVFAIAATLTTSRLSCVEVLGAGHVQAFTEISAAVGLPVQLALDLTEDASGAIWVVDADNFIHGFDKDLNYLATIPIPFTGPDDIATGIAYRASSGTLLVCNAFDDTIHEFDFLGTPVAPPFVVQLPVLPNEDLIIGSMVFDPAGDTGAGSLYVLELSRSMIYEVSLTGTILNSFDHPDEAREPTPDDSFFDTYLFGISGVPEVGGGYEQLDVAGGNVFARKCTHIVRIDSSTGAVTGFELPVDDIETVNSVRFLTHHNSTYLGNPVAFVISIRGSDNVLLRVDRTPPPVTAVSYLECRQPTLADIVEISFENHGPYDAIEIERDGAVIAMLPGTAVSYTDAAVTVGRHSYEVTAVLAGQRAETRRCSLRVGPGAVLRRTTLWPVVSPYQMARNPVDGSFLITTNSPTTADFIYRFDANLQFVDVIDAPVDDMTYQTAAIAVRPFGGSYQIYTISWALRVPQGMPQVFLLTAQDPTGNEILGPLVVDIPGAPPGVAITYPAALAYDDETDTFWFLERNTDTFWNLDPSGTLIQSFPHPAPPAQNFVFNIGLAYDATRHAFTATTADFADTEITKTIGMTTTGLLIGENIPLEAAAINPLNGLARADGRIWVSGSVGELSQMLELKAGDALPPPVDLLCAETAPNIVTLTWIETGVATEVEIRRGGVLIATIPGGVEQYVDAGVGLGPRAYTVTTRSSAAASEPSACAVIVAGGTPFLRGDATHDGGVNIADAIFVLSYLFSSGPTPVCPDAADVDDNGAINIGDAIYLLTFLFNSGLQPPQPFPLPGGDPTLDAMSCP